MSKTTVVTARISSEIVADLDRLATHYDRSRAWLIANAIDQYMKHENELHDFIKVGIDEADRGNVISHSKMEAWFEERVENRALAIAAE